MPAKIFGIGLPKSGTSSLHRAMQLLGLRSVHFLNDERTVEQLKNGEYDLDALRAVDFACDIPIPAIYRELEGAYPGSKYILSERDVETWLLSQARATAKRPIPGPNSIRDYYRALLYGTNVYHETTYRHLYEDHLSGIDRFFSGPTAARLLRINVISGEGWEKLCPFLGLPVPRFAFPHENKGAVPSPSGGAPMRGR